MRSPGTTHRWSRRAVGPGRSYRDRARARGGLSAHRLGLPGWHAERHMSSLTIAIGTVRDTVAVCPSCADRACLRRAPGDAEAPPWSPGGPLEVPPDRHHKTQSRRESSRATLVVTHGVHPFRGREVPLLWSFRKGGRSFVVVRFPDGGHVSMPVEWTDQRPAPRPPRVRGRTPLLDPHALCELSARVADLRVRSDRTDRTSTATDGKLAPDRKPSKLSAGREGSGRDLPSATGEHPSGAPGHPRQRDPQSGDQRPCRRKRGRR